MGGKGVSERMERYALADSGRIGRLMEQAVELAGCHRLTGPLAWKQPALLHGSCGIETPLARLPPLPQQLERVGRQHDIAVLAALGPSLFAIRSHEQSTRLNKRSQSRSRG